ncbi:MAG TPA: diguanylate cyclase [Pirellulaceae bacterium]|nr:diguanylate cyclase [Pirellulaceae bacterium]
MTSLANCTKRVLIVEDDEGDAVLVERALARSEFDTSRADSREAALEQLAAAPCAAVLFDLSLPDSFGLDGVDVLRERFPDLPIIVVTGLSDEQLALEALHRGAQDYLVKGAWSPDLLVRSLRYSIHRQHVQSENRRLLAELERQARHDALTGLLNRRSLLAELEREWSRSNRTGEPLSCVMLDLDYFKRINDNHGHTAGDSVLQTVAAAIRTECRQSDLVGRYGGEEFCIVLPATSQELAMAWAERIRWRLANTPLQFGGEPVAVTASLGVAERTPATPKPQALVERADQALRLAKQLGRDRVVASDRLSTISTSTAAYLSDQTSATATAAELMSPPEAVLCPTATLKEAAQHLLGTRTNALPVVSDQGHLLGIVGERELANAVSSPRDWTRPVTDVMQRKPPCFGQWVSAQVIREFLARSGASQVVVIEGQRPLGLVSRFAVLRWLHWRDSVEPRRDEFSDPNCLADDSIADLTVDEGANALRQTEVFSMSGL